MNYRQRRHEVDLTIYTIAKELGISKEKYLEIDRGERELSGALLDKFLEITTPKKAKEINFNRKERMRTINKWLLEEGMNKTKEMGYLQKDLAKVTGISQNSISLMFNGGREFSDDLKEQLYDFLNNPLNKVIEKPAKETTKKSTKKPTKKPTKVSTEKTTTTEEKPIKLAPSEPVKETISKETYDYLLYEYKKLQRQITLYEKLIERL